VRLAPAIEDRAKAKVHMIALEAYSHEHLCSRGSCSGVVRGPRRYFLAPRHARTFGKRFDGRCDVILVLIVCEPGKDDQHANDAERDKRHQRGKARRAAHEPCEFHSEPPGIDEDGGGGENKRQTRRR